MKNSRLLAFAQLLRLPNVFTAFADILMATAAVGLLGHHFGIVFHVGSSNANRLLPGNAEGIEIRLTTAV